MSYLPLEKVVVLDLTRHRAGPVTSRLLGDFGATVIKIDAPTDLGDSMGGSREGFDYQNLHRNKMSLSLNLKTDEGRAVFYDLVRKADVVLENFRPEVKHRLGVDYETISEVNPRIVYGSISGFGQTGPYRTRPAVDQTIQGMSGLMSVTGFPGQPPVRAGAAVADISAGMVLSQGVLMALYHREKTGEGQWVHTSLLESLVSMLDFQVVRYLDSGESPRAVGNDHPTLMPTGLFPTADGHVNIAAAEELKFKALCEALEIPELVSDPLYADTALRSENRTALCDILARRTRVYSSEELQRKLDAAGIPCGQLYTIGQMMEDAQMQSLRMADEGQHPHLGAVPLLGQPLHLEGCGGRPPVRFTAPDHGEHTDQILSEWLGMARSDIQAFRERGII
ncbi:CaiB/BaiF CoA transferase family protein [Chromobacterium piscinae]|uniref:CaiB/BaiF CoA-transferase family protein n=1 Tax=Chromobacterium piscinae TaxID=686831 RepID=A0ABV0H8D6_9NEIS|nr:CaiB/BaiF CoA-transferase family protein [Chromobacterium piscinae]MBX9296626.1 CoA transferase [Chromobacterium vaccinii]MBX9348548.1 CoA transferase [Chromobacterium vaccinii]MBX9359539.1 CoA transferase [Chromobacterium vaccinii]MCD4504921.1 CoA transferase [Chromobacterium piscinae]NHQ81271.1 CoA transferase [Chromobacterium vaccinii]